MVNAALAAPMWSGDVRGTRSDCVPRTRKPSKMLRERELLVSGFRYLLIIGAGNSQTEA